MTCKQQMVTSDLSVHTNDIKHLSHHGTKACIHTDRENWLLVFLARRWQLASCWHLLVRCF